ncbi:GvpL/GvpF family gas vesicle protein [Plantactinospora sonchi]|uniref:GvpL/GvpF family gas vesicle protein n=1 Tax=Plantactinospora sonchi TaxID=1544735 RepID=A0ABU7RRL2_9ACTN
MTRSPAIWVYALAREPLPVDRLAGLSGVDGTPVDTVVAAGLVAVTGRVDPDRYDTETLRRNLSDLAWLEPTARAHHRVTEEVWRLGPVVPVRLATVYRDEAAVRAVLTERRTELAVALDQVVGRAEWGVKGYVSDRPAVPATEGGAAGGGLPGAGAGADYLRRRRAALQASEAAQEAAVRDAAAVHAVLARHAEAARQHRPQERALSGVAEQMMLNGAYLVASERATEFGDLVGRLGATHPNLRLELTGPWPPYSFAALAEEPTGGGSERAVAR